MRRSLVSRIAGLVIAMLVGISAPGLAFAHGHAHYEASEHADADRAHGGAPVTEAADGLRDERSRSIRASNESTGHAHVQLATALLVRMDALVFILPPIPLAIPVGIIFVSTTSLVPTAAPARAAPADVPPSQPRAPPLG